MLYRHNLPAVAATVAAMCLAAPLMAPVTSGPTSVILLTGSDGDTFHGHAPYATDVRDFLKGSSTKDVLVLGDVSATEAYSAAVGGVDITTVSSLAGVNLSDFSALYLLSASDNGPGCCEADVARILGFEAAIQDFIASGGSLGIQDYTGDPGFDPILGTAGGANGEVFGWMGGLGGPNNYDDEVVTPEGSAAGFMEYPVLGAWGHQGFRMSFFSTLGFVSLIDAPVYGAEVSGLMVKEGIVDSDGDGIPDDEDACPESNLTPTIVIDGCDSGVENVAFEDGCTMMDLIAECAEGASNHGEFLSCVANLTNGWNQAGYISGQEKGQIRSCAAQSSIPGDLDGDGSVGATDLLILLATWGPCPAPPAACAADIDWSGNVGVPDFLILLGNWG
ncbi:MAG: hypothetical protein ACYTFF_16600 [Planctomycetota bacterium]|jgi:hypothetical protein